MIKLKNLSYIVEKDGQEKNILKNIDVEFPKGKLTCITGHNGSGKSTLVKLVMGIIMPSEGGVFFDGKDITHLSIDERANLGLTLAYQQPIRFKGITVKDLISFAAKNENISINDACSYLSKVGLCARDYINREVDETLSGGELKRIEIALALAKGGKVFLFDEPEAGIDLWSFDALVEIFKSLKGKTVIVVSHQKKILELADFLLLINDECQPLLKPRNQLIHALNQPKCAKIGGDNE